MSKKILCVDDSSTIRMLVKKSLQPEGYEVLEAENGKDAMGKCADDIALYLVDVNMPEMNGFEFVEALKKTPAGKDKPVVFLTTESSAEKKDMGKNLGVKGWIVKPFEPPALLKIVNMLTG